MTGHDRDVTPQLTATERDGIAQQLRSLSAGLRERQFYGAETGSETEIFQFINDPEKVPCSRQIVRNLIGMLADQPESSDRSLSRDLSSMGEFFSSLADSVEQSIITQDEAEALIKAVLEGFVSRRLYKTLRGMAHPGKSWFLTAFHQQHGG
jgi:hypothetical protein